jgi:adenylyltransferase/sulfurtransferase
VQALETIKLILGVGDPLIGRLAHIDTLGMNIRVLRLRRDTKCPMCGDQPTITKLIDYEEFCGLRNTGESRSADAA